MGGMTTRYQRGSTGLRGDAADASLSARRTHFEQHLVAELRHAWPLDATCAMAMTIAVITRSVVVWFHIVFLVLALAALVLPYRRFVVRLAVWTTISAALVAWSVVGGHTPAVELTELPLLTAVLVLTYLGAQARGHVVDRLTLTQADLVARTENELEALRHQLEQAQRLELLGRASQSIAHDLRSVFTVINGCATDLNDEMRGRRAIGRVHEINAATERGIGIVSDLLLSGRRRAEIAGPVDLDEVTQHLEPLLRRLTGRMVTLRLARGGDPVLAQIDRTSVLQILMNLVVNATEAIDGTGCITVTCEQVVWQQPGSTPRAIAVLTVADDGSGIPDEAAGMIFESGFSTKGDDHSGLGLATVCRIVERWGGSIDVQSTPGKGTTVRVELPLHQDARRAVVVIADDGARALLATELEASGYEVLATDCPLDACDLLADVASVELAFVDGPSSTDQSLQSALESRHVRRSTVLDGQSTHSHQRLPVDRHGVLAILAGALHGPQLAIH
jgi:signal transduction histidine kinase